MKGLDASTFGRGDAGNVSITVRDAITFDGVGSDGNSSGARSQVNSGAVGKGGTLTLSAGSLTVTNGAQLASGTFSQGDAGNVSITVRDAATFDGVGSNGLSSFAASQFGPNAVGKGGTLTLTAGSLTVTNGAELGASTFGRGDAGNVSITIRDAATFDGVGRNGGSSGVGSQVNSGAVGKGGTLTLSAGSLTVTNGAQLAASTFGRGDAGNVSITVRDAATFDGVGRNGGPSFAGSVVNPKAMGKGGTFTLNAGSLTVTNGAALSSSTLGQGDAGDVLITVRDAAIFDGRGRNGGSFAGSQVNSNAMGNGGTLTLSASSLTVTNGAQLTSSTFGRGDAGNISITVRDAATFDGRSFTASQVGPNAVGKGGTLTLSTGSLTITNGAGLISSSFGQGDAGDIVVRVRGMLQISDGFIETLSEQTDGGSIDITAKSIQLIGTTNIVTSVFGGIGNGGNITLSADSIVALNDSDILAFARNGKGGNITLNTRAFFGQNYRPAPFGTDPRTLDGNDRVDINASGTVSGTITQPDTSFIQNSLTQLPKSGIDTDALAAQLCVMRTKEPEGTFYIVGSGGIVNRPNDLKISDYPTNTVQPIASPQRAWKLGDPIVEPTGFYQLADGRMIMARECEPPASSQPTPTGLPGQLTNHP